MGCLCPGEYHQPRGTHIQSMNRWLPGDIGEETTQAAGKTVLFVCTPAWYGEQAARFDDDDKLRIPVEYFHHNCSIPQSINPSKGWHLVVHGG